MQHELSAARRAADEWQDAASRAQVEGAAEHAEAAALRAQVKAITTENELAGECFWEHPKEDGRRVESVLQPPLTRPCPAVDSCGPQRRRSRR